MKTHWLMFREKRKRRMVKDSRRSQNQYEGREPGIKTGHEPRHFYACRKDAKVYQPKQPGLEPLLLLLWKNLHVPYVIVFLAEESQSHVGACGWLGLRYVLLLWLTMLQRKGTCCLCLLPTWKGEGSALCSKCPLHQRWSTWTGGSWMRKGQRGCSLLSVNRVPGALKTYRQNKILEQQSI